MADNYIMELRFTHLDRNPENIRSRDVAKAIAAFEEAVAIVAAREPGSNLDPYTTAVGLVGARVASLDLQFQSPYPEAISRAYRLVAGAIASERFGDIPTPALRKLKSVRAFIRKVSGHAEFWEVFDDQATQLATMTPSIVIEVPLDALRGVTTLYGRVVRVGGEKKQTVSLRLLDNSLLLVDAASEELAKQIAHRLYSRVGLIGTATYDPVSLSMLEFTANELSEYSETPLEDAFQSLREVLGPYIDAIDDIEAYFSDIRGDSDEV